MREIKFRAWDGERLRIVGGLGWVDGELDNVLTPKYHGPVEDDVVVMQFTGLQDDNGKDIFESDFVDSDFVDGLMVVKFGSHMTSTDYYACWAYGWYAETEKEETFSLNRHYKIVGNIYENPELLLND